MILHIFDYRGFLQLACNKGQKTDSQKVQNTGIYLCYFVIEQIIIISIERLHNKMGNISLEQKRRV